jgi:1,4-dihydroxy-2-naphthoate octaprenyltransferase
MNIIRFWLRNSRPQSLPQSMLPAILAVCLASSYAGFSLPLGILGALGVMAGHLGLNLFDDYFDYRKKKSDYRETLAHEGFRARIGKCPYLTSGATTVESLLFACCIFCGISLLFGAVIFYYRGMYILYIALATAVLGISYSGAPLRLSYHGLGEIVIGAVFGPLAMLGTFYSACGVASPLIVFISIPVGMLVTNIVYVHSILDFEPDKKIGKRTLAVLLNNKKAMLAALFTLLFAPYAIIAYAALNGYMSVCYLAVFLSIPLAITLFALMLKYVGDPQRQFEPKRWMGPMANWDRVRAAGIDWFMLRWYLARNLLSAFCFIIIIVSFIVKL